MLIAVELGVLFIVVIAEGNAVSELEVLDEMLPGVELDKGVKSEGDGVSAMDVDDEGDTVTDTLDVNVHVAASVGERVIDTEGDLARVGVREDDVDLVIVPEILADTDWDKEKDLEELYVELFERDAVWLMLGDDDIE